MFVLRRLEERLFGVYITGWLTTLEFGLKDGFERLERFDLFVASEFASYFSVLMRNLSCRPIN